MYIYTSYKNSYTVECLVGHRFLWKGVGEGEGIASTYTHYHSWWEAATRHGQLNSALCVDPEGCDEGGSRGSGYMCGCMLRCFSCIRLFVTPWSVACQAPLSLGFSKQEYWNGLPCLLPWDLPDLGTETFCLCLLHRRWFFTQWATCEAQICIHRADSRCWTSETNTAL